MEIEELLKGEEAFESLPEQDQLKIQKWDSLYALQDHYPLFKIFMKDCFRELKGFETDKLQQDIAGFMQETDRLQMVQAQRGQAKSMIGGSYVVWRLIQDPSTRVLIISAGSDVANEIATWVKLIIDNWDILECLKPDRSHGDRTSASAFDVHWMIKGTDKSPSVRSIGITSNLAGRRADLILADDIESSKNGLTALQREQLTHLSKDFPNICSVGKILYLGTPQTTDSLYNGLEERGYNVRVWPGRYPTRDEEVFYGERLAPYIQKKLIDDKDLRTGGGVNGKRGQPTSELIKDEEQLTADELEMGDAYFDLQVMLNTTKSDLRLYPLNTRKLLILDVPVDKNVGDMVWLPNPDKKMSYDYEVYYPHNVSVETFEYEGKMMYIDPAGGGANGDETVAVVSYLLHGYVFIPEMLALQGGYDEGVFIDIAEAALRNGVRTIVVEENFGKGAFAVMLRPVVQRVFKEAGKQFPEVVDDWVNTNKEKRIIDTLEPIMARGKLVLSPEVLEYDRVSVKKYPSKHQDDYRLMYQMSKIQVGKRSLKHDDRLDSLSGAVRHWLERLNVDPVKRINETKLDFGEKVRYGTFSKRKY